MGLGPTGKSILLLLTYTSLLAALTKADFLFLIMRAKSY
jgi:hypothetical protein